ncbi:MAG: hypothetical protein FJ210_01565 [Betaproteobacteria bacterium]|nr:hypothetical protein [Betaproteobacteria bacterium]
MQVTKFRVWLFSLMLVCFQQLGFAHAITHFTCTHFTEHSHASTQEADHADAVCELCELHAQTGTGLLPQLPRWAPVSTAPTYLAPAPQPCLTRFSRRYHSRAPPVLA